MIEWVPPEFLTAWFFLLGLCVGSFLNVCIARLPVERSVVFPPSACPSCGARIRWYDNLPLLSYALLRGRCRACGGGISPVYPLVELCGGLIFSLQYVHQGVSPEMFRGAVLLCCLLVLFCVDLRHMLLPDLVTLPGAAAGLAFAAAGWSPVGFLDSVLGSVTGALTLIVIMGVYWLVRRQQGMGWGDVKMMLTIGAFLGLKGLIVTLVIASFGGGIFGTALLVLRRKGLEHAIPFGCFLAPAAAFTYFVGTAPLDWYLSLLQL